MPFLLSNLLELFILINMFSFIFLALAEFTFNLQILEANYASIYFIFRT